MNSNQRKGIVKRYKPKTKMNKVEHKIVKVIEKPTLDDSVVPGWYSIKVLVNCYGIKKLKK